MPAASLSRPERCTGSEFRIIFEATGADIADLGEEHGHRVSVWVSRRGELLDASVYPGFVTERQGQQLGSAPTALGGVPG